MRGWVERDMRLIDADKLKESVPETHVDIFENCRHCRLLDKDEVCDLIDDAHTIDAVPVARIKDLCERWVDGCAMCTHMDCDKCWLKDCIEELKEMIDGMCL